MACHAFITQVKDLSNKREKWTYTTEQYIVQQAFTSLLENLQHLVAAVTGTFHPDRLVGFTKSICEVVVASLVLPCSTVEFQVICLILRAVQIGTFSLLTLQ